MWDVKLGNHVDLIAKYGEMVLYDILKVKGDEILRSVLLFNLD